MNYVGVGAETLEDCPVLTPIIRGLLNMYYKIADITAIFFILTENVLYYPCFAHIQLIVNFV